MKPCDSCKVNVGSYQENKYTLLCRTCWIYISNNILNNWEKAFKNEEVLVMPWVYNSDKVIIS